MKDDKLHNGSAGYGSLTNMLRFERVYMIEHQEGIGNDESPFCRVRTFFNEEGDFLGRIDPRDTFKKQ